MRVRRDTHAGHLLRQIVAIWLALIRSEAAGTPLEGYHSRSKEKLAKYLLFRDPELASHPRSMSFMAPDKSRKRKLPGRVCRMRKCDPLPINLTHFYSDAIE